MSITSNYVLPWFQDIYRTSIVLLILGLLSYFFQRSKKDGQSKSFDWPTKIQEKGKTKTVESDPSRKEEKADKDDFFDESMLVPPLIPDDLDHIPFKQDKKLSKEESLEKSDEFYRTMAKRRTIRFFSPEPIPVAIIQNIIRTAATSPSGAHTEPWTYVAVQDPEIKEKIREIVEEEEETNYSRRMGDQWTHDLKGLGTSWVKEYLTTAPWVILVFRQAYKPLDDGRRRTHYYNEISTSISAGIFLTAVHMAGLATLTSSPLNCGPALRTLLGRPAHEKLLLLLPLGYASQDATVPDLQRKPLEEVMVVI